MWTTLRWSQNDFSMVQCFQTYWERSTNSVCIENTRFASCNERNFCPQRRPFWYRPFHLHHVRAMMHEIRNRSNSDRESIQNATWCISFSNYGLDDILFVAEFSHLWPWGRPFFITYFGSWEKVQRILDDASVGCTFFQEMPACATDYSFTPIWKAFFALRFRVCLEQLIRTTLRCPCDVALNGL